MHEFSICENLVNIVVSETEKLGPGQVRLVSAMVVVGDLRQIVPDYLKQAYEILTKDTVAEGSALEISSAPVAFRCENCGWQGEISKHEFRCRACSSSRVEIVGGMELYLKNLEVETDD